MRCGKFFQVISSPSILLLLYAMLPSGCAKSNSTSGSSEPSSAAPKTPGATGTATGTSGGGTPNAAGPTNTGTGTSPANAPAATNIVPIAWPYLGFVNNPGGNDLKAVALTFDDGPDGVAPNQWGKASPSNMSYMLDQLDKLGLKATFFLCGQLWTDVTTDTQAQADIQRMVKSGHHFGSHTLTHQILAANTARNIAAGNTTMSLTQVQNEFTGNQNAFSGSQLLGASAAHFTMYRAPYGYPFQDGIVYPANANSIVDDVAGVAAGTPPNAVHVGWGIDTKDWQCAQSNSNSSCILNNLNAFLDAGASGPILMHAVYKLSADTLPQVVQSIKNHGYHIVMVEDMIKAKYGANSADIARANATTTFSATTINNAAVAAAMQSKWYKGTNEN